MQSQRDRESSATQWMKMVFVLFAYFNLLINSKTGSSFPVEHPTHEILSGHICIHDYKHATWLYL